MSIDVDFYKAPGPMTDLTALDDELFASLSGPGAIVAAVRGVVLHRFWVQAYGVEVPAEREAEIQLRSASAMVRRLLENRPPPFVAGA